MSEGVVRGPRENQRMGRGDGTGRIVSSDGADDTGTAPCLPAAWKFFEARLTGATGSLHIRLENPDGLASGDARLTVDGAEAPPDGIAFPSDGETREVRCLLRRRIALLS